jgi:hypothetical protein
LGFPEKQKPVRVFLLVLVVVEALGLVAVGAVAAFADLDSLGRQPPPAPAFRPYIHDAVIGDRVRYQIRRNDEITGYVEYEVIQAVEFEGTNLGREFLIRITPYSRSGRAESPRLMRIRPRAVRIGFLPPRIEDDDDFPSGARPVVKSIRTASFALREVPNNPAPPVDGFLLETVIPRDSLTEVAERYWMTPEIPVFGVARWERDDEVLVVHTMEKARRKRAG